MESIVGHRGASWSIVKHSTRSGGGLLGLLGLGRATIDQAYPGILLAKEFASRLRWQRGAKKSGFREVSRESPFGRRSWSQLEQDGMQLSSHTHLHHVQHAAA